MKNPNVMNLPDWQRTRCDTPLQAWYMENIPKKEMIYAESMQNQFTFIRDEVVRIFGENNVKIIEAVSVHTSKSILLPVYRFVVKNIEIIARCNFHDWKVSVWSEEEINVPTSLFYEEGKVKINSCYCEGFKDDWVLDCYDNNKTKFTVELDSGEHKMWTFLFLINEQLNKR